MAHGDSGDVWAALAYWLINKDDAMLAREILLGLKLTQRPIPAKVAAKLEEIAAPGPNENTRNFNQNLGRGEPL
jgi:hypothetical protein